MTFHERVAQAKREILIETLNRCGWNRRRAANELGLNRTYIYRLMRELEIYDPQSWLRSAARAGAVPK